MNSKPSKVVRLLDLLAFLSTRRFPVSGETLLSELPAYRVRWVHGTDMERDSVRRMFERDKQELRALGIPLRVETEPGNDEASYSLKYGEFYLPVLRLLGDAGPPGSASRRAAPLGPRNLQMMVEGLQHVMELPSFPLRREARSALRKLTFDLATGLADGDQRIVHLPPFDPLEIQDILESATEAILGRRPLGFDYYAIGADRQERRSVHPRGLVYQGSRWYLVAWDPTRGGERLFRVDRMSDVVMEGAGSGGAAFEIPADYGMDHLRRRDPWELGGEGVEDVDVEFLPPLSLLAERNGWGQAVASDGQGAAESSGTVRRFRVRSSGPFLRWLMTHGEKVRIHTPTRLADEADDMRRRILEIHR
ncbi:MAG: WYL domain-containing protein [Gemmatimonadales bacterium]|nr:MAG: WYL domain-containing protein [Gemmatimonadales bacterium]